jgi:hypothetical protein
MRACSLPRISAHAVERWQQRVDQAASPAVARRALNQFVRHGQARPTPRRWMKDVRQTPGLRFVYCADRPGVCVLVMNNTALTVVTRTLCRPAAQLRRAQTRRREHGRTERRPGPRHQRTRRCIVEAAEEAA